MTLPPPLLCVLVPQRHTDCKQESYRTHTAPEPGFRSTARCGTSHQSSKVHLPGLIPLLPRPQPRHLRSLPHGEACEGVSGFSATFRSERIVEVFRTDQFLSTIPSWNRRYSPAADRFASRQSEVAKLVRFRRRRLLRSQSGPHLCYCTVPPIAREPSYPGRRTPPILTSAASYNNSPLDHGSSLLFSL